nr:polyadenylate-binding protein, cytoplasmic and nuclear-like [Arachis hypogaea]
MGNHRTWRQQFLGKDPRVWNREEYFRLEQDSFTIFVDRLPVDISKQKLFGLFSWMGRINDIYLSRKMRSGVVYLFAFIRYTTKGGALKAISEMNRLCLREKEIFVGEAKYRRDISKGKKTRKNVDIRREPNMKKVDGGISQVEHRYPLADRVVDRGIRMVPTESQPGGSKAMENVNDPHGSNMLKDVEGSGIRKIQASVAENN